MAELQKLIRQSKSQMWGDCSQHLRGAEVWRVAQYANSRAGMTVAASMDRKVKQANAATKREVMLRGQSFPLNNDNKYYELPAV